MEDATPIDNEIAQLVSARRRLRDQLFLQTGAMFRYCAHRGINIPEQMLQRFDTLRSAV
jgi:hypothetical protein